jgi:hypothetical protein
VAPLFSHLKLSGCPIGPLINFNRSCPDISRDSSFDVKPEDVAKLTPEGFLLVRKYSELQDRAMQFARQKRESMSNGKMLISD